MIIVLDGPEKVGKTTLAKAIIKAWPERHNATGFLTYRHWNTSWPDEIDFRLRDARLHGRDEIWDRTYLSEMVYTPLLGRTDQHPLFMPGVISRMHKVMQQVAHVWVLVGSIDRLKALRDDDDLPVDPEIEQIRYAHVAGQAGVPLIEVDHYTTDEAVCIILNSLKGRR